MIRGRAGQRCRLNDGAAARRGGRRSFALRLHALCWAATLAAIVVPAGGNLRAETVPPAYAAMADTCRRSGGVVETTLEQVRAGRRFLCVRAAAEPASDAETADCRPLARTVIDRIFAERESRVAFAAALARGAAPVETLLGLVRNPAGQQAIEACRPFAQAYLAGLAVPSTPRADAVETPSPSRETPLSQDLCRCISVQPSGTTAEGRKRLDVTNTCKPLDVSVLLSSDRTRGVAESGGASVWTAAGIVADGARSAIAAPAGWNVVTIKAIAMSGGSARLLCRY